MFILSSCKKNDEIKMRIGDSIEIQFYDETVKYSIDYIGKSDKFFTIKVKYIGTSVNDYEFVIKDSSAISYIMVGDTRIDSEQIQSIYPNTDQYVIPFFEKEVDIDIYYAYPSEDADHSAIIIKKSYNNNNDGYAEHPEIYDELKRYGIFIGLK